ncbi:winged helix-turn-helix domain-containing protein [Jannaschia sp. R86511]|uniref:winged helix-turn-helix domain-containing protein n=1 Tax=Jannaschia sp. R86511 TaxID=3093853 RepID=UPI0036D43CDE
MPVVVLSARATSDDMIEALDAGADDYVTKPFDMGELLARLRAATRRPRSGPETEAVIRTDAFTLDLALRTLTRDGDQVRLTPTEWHLVEILARAGGRVVSQRALLDELRGPGVPSQSHYLRVYVAQLRRKLEPDPSAPRYVLTEPGVGYRLVV